MTWIRRLYDKDQEVISFTSVTPVNTVTNAKVINCRSPDFKSPIGPTKNLERLYNRVVVRLVVRSVVATLVITASSHSPDQTR